MLNKLVRIAFAAVGALAGYALYSLVSFIFSVAGKPLDQFLPETAQLIIVILFAIIFAAIFFIRVPAFAKRGKKAAAAFDAELQKVSGGTIIAGTIGLIAGLLIATLLSQLLRVIPDQRLQSASVIAVYIVFGFLGIAVAVSKGQDIAKNSRLFRREQAPEGGRKQSLAKARRREGIPKVLDTSVIIDGRIADLMRTGFIEGPIVIPDFVLDELRHIADSTDSLKRARGRHGMDILNGIREEFGVEVYNTVGEKALKDVREVDVKLLRLAEALKGKVMTNDYNLNKVAGVSGIQVLNINELANALKPVALPGEKMTVSLVKKGKDARQAVAYLADGTMVVVEDGAPKLGDTVKIVVTSALQTAAGRMIFGRLSE